MNGTAQKPVEAFLNLHPKWNRRWEETEDGRVVILIPKFGSHLLGRWLMSKLRQPYMRLRLDEVGSFVWQRCNGMHSVREIGAEMEKTFGPKVDPVYGRLQVFLRQLERNKSIVWVEAQAAT